MPVIVDKAVARCVQQAFGADDLTALARALAVNHPEVDRGEHPSQSQPEATEFPNITMISCNAAQNATQEKLLLRCVCECLRAEDGRARLQSLLGSLDISQIKQEPLRKEMFDFAKLMSPWSESLSIEALKDLHSSFESNGSLKLQKSLVALPTGMKIMDHALSTYASRVHFSGLSVEMRAVTAKHKHRSLSPQWGETTAQRNPLASGVDCECGALLGLGLGRHAH